MPRIKEHRPVTSVWSSYGHRFMSDGNGADEFGYFRESCLTCGAEFELHATPGKPWGGEYVGFMGEPPTECTRDTSMVHGQDDMHAFDCADGCEHCQHDCNCVLCAS